MATPVWAAPSLGDGVTVTEGDGITGSQISTEKIIDGSKSVTVRATVPAEYTMSITKTVKIENTGLTASSVTDFTYTVTSYNLPAIIWDRDKVCLFQQTVL